MSARTRPAPIRLLTVRDVASRASVSADYVRQAIHASDPYSIPPPLPAARPGKKYLIKEEDANQWMHELFENSPI